MEKDSPFSQEIRQIAEGKRAEVGLPPIARDSERAQKMQGILSLMRNDALEVAPILSRHGVAMNYRRYVGPSPVPEAALNYEPDWRDELIGGWQIIDEPDTVNIGLPRPSSIAILVSGALDGRGRYSAFDIINAMSTDDMRRRDNVQIPLELIRPRIVKVENQPFVARWRNAIRFLVRQAQYS
ncbi:MAG: hypothetical protein ABSB12_03880 [Candidatus Saccharimonadales bacterium]|jgi:hypothetical protein